MESKSLNLWKQQLVTLPASLWEQTALLHELHLRNNQFRELPPGSWSGRISRSSICDG